MKDQSHEIEDQIENQQRQGLMGRGGLKKSDFVGKIERDLDEEFLASQRPARPPKQTPAPRNKP